MSASMAFARAGSAIIVGVPVPAVLMLHHRKLLLLHHPDDCHNHENGEQYSDHPPETMATHETMR
jgi:hypothetical protein